jgi:hypothetical protein
VEYDGDNLNSAEELGLLVSNQNDMILNWSYYHYAAVTLI